MKNRCKALFTEVGLFFVQIGGNTLSGYPSPLYSTAAGRPAILTGVRSGMQRSRCKSHLPVISLFRQRAERPIAVFMN
jgi:hypothetical protein